MKERRKEKLHRIESTQLEAIDQEEQLQLALKQALESNRNRLSIILESITNVMLSEHYTLTSKEDKDSFHQILRSLVHAVFAKSFITNYEDKVPTIMIEEWSESPSAKEPLTQEYKALYADFFQQLKFVYFASEEKKKKAFLDVFIAISGLAEFIIKANNTSKIIENKRLRTKYLQQVFMHEPSYPIRQNNLVLKGLLQYDEKERKEIDGVNTSIKKQFRFVILNSPWLVIVLSKHIPHAADIITVIRDISQINREVTVISEVLTPETDILKQFSVVPGYTDEI
jgi:hypothetical protein